MRHAIISSVQRLVVKVGTSSIIKDNGLINNEFIFQLANSVVLLKKKNIETCIVCSGAVGAGALKLGMKTKPKRLPEKQALAAVGQIQVMNAFSAEFAKLNIKVGQVLLTHEVLTDRSRYLNARNTINSLFELSCVPVINENDTVSTEELGVGDNDTLSAYVTNLIEADLLILLSDIDGLMTADPKKDESASLISEVDDIEKVMPMAGATSGFGTGGLQTKLKAAKIVTQCGEGMIIANSKTPEIINRIMNGEALGTFFLPSSKNMQSRKRWLAFNLVVAGKLFIDEGAEKALIAFGKSLLPSGITRIEGQFSEKDLVTIIGPSGKVIAKGLINYSSEEMLKIKGVNTSEIEKILGYCPYESIVHRDHMVLMEGIEDANR